MAFGRQDGPKDLRFSSFKKQVSLASSARLPGISNLGRSGQQYHLCYNLKHIAIESEGGFSMIRQAAIHHQFDVVTGKTLWLVTAGRRSLQERYKSKYYGAIRRIQALNTYRFNWERRKGREQIIREPTRMSSVKFSGPCHVLLLVNRELEMVSQVT